MRELNYIPKAVKDRRLKGRTLKVLVTVVSVLVVVYITLLVQVGHLEGKEIEVQEHVRQVKELEQGIQEEQVKLTELTKKTGTINTNPIPLNLFLGTILKYTPKDVVIYDIFTEGQERVERERWEEVNDTENREGTESREGTEGIEDELEEDLEKGKNEEVEGDGEAEVAREDWSRDINPSRAGESKTVKYITIRGSAFNLQSISTLAHTINNQVYIQDVEISPVENYDDGNFQHKLFELRFKVGGNR